MESIFGKREREASPLMVVCHSARRKAALASEMRAGRLARVPSAKLPPMRRLPRGSARRRLRIALFPPLARLSNNWNVWFVARRAPAASTSGPASVACSGTRHTLGVIFHQHRHAAGSRLRLGRGSADRSSSDPDCGRPQPRLELGAEFPGDARRSRHGRPVARAAGAARTGLRCAADRSILRVSGAPSEAPVSKPISLAWKTYCATTAGGCQVPSPGGRIEGASLFGQYRRITR